MRGKLYFVLIFMLIILTSASAYLDPGTGSMIVSAIIGVFATVIYCFKGFFYKIFNLLRGKKNNSNEES